MIIERFEKGTYLCAMYMGAPYIGRVTDSRVKYGGRLQYALTLNEPTLVAGREEPTLDILIYQENIISVQIQ
jgi:hypothetical protein